MCDCLDNPPEFYNCRDVKGRKAHECCECLGVIAKGDQHEYVKGVWDGEFQDYRTCAACCAMRSEIKLTCYCYGQMMEQLDERDYPGVQSVADFLDRRRKNWLRRRQERLVRS